MTQLMPFTFQDVRLKEACWINKKPYFTRRAIGEWLGAKHPNRYVHKIIERNPYIKQFSIAVRLTVEDTTPLKKIEPSFQHLFQDLPYPPDTAGSVPNLSTEQNFFPEGSFVRLTNEPSYETQQIETEVYDPIGLQLIVMESHLPKALAYKIAVAHLVWAYMNGELARLRPKQGQERAQGLQKWSPERGRVIKAIAAQRNVCVTTIYRQIDRFERGLPVDGRSTRTHKVWTKNREKYATVVDLFKNGKKQAEIERITGYSPGNIYKWCKKYRKENEN